MTIDKLDHDTCSTLQSIFSAAISIVINILSDHLLQSGINLDTATLAKNLPPLHQSRIFTTNSLNSFGDVAIQRCHTDVS